MDSSVEQDAKYLGEQQMQNTDHNPLNHYSLRASLGDETESRQVMRASIDPKAVL